jgi:hypothetical protein
MSAEYIKPPLLTEEKQLLEQLVQIAEGIGRMKERTFLNAKQEGGIVQLERKGYVTLTKKKFMVVFPP